MNFLKIYKQSFAIPAVIISGFLFNGFILSNSNQNNPAQHSFQKQNFLFNESASDDYPSIPDVIKLSDRQISTLGIKTETAGAHALKLIMDLPGEIRLNEDLTSHITPPLPGLVKKVAVNLGDSVKKDQLLLSIASPVITEKSAALAAAQKRLDMARETYNREKSTKMLPEHDTLYSQQAILDAENAVRNAQQKLKVLGANPYLSGAEYEDANLYEIRAPFDGVIVDKHIGLGVAVKENDNVLTISDLSTVWAEFNVSAKDLNNLRIGDHAKIAAIGSDAKTIGKLSYLGQLIGDNSQSAIARVQIENPRLAWRNGLKVNIEILADKNNSPVAVNVEALSLVNGATSVFVRTADGFAVQKVITGRSDNHFVEIEKGLNPNTEYASDAEAVINAQAIQAEESE
jgi:membrane fusion protein, heavy metal efflux system